MYVNPFRFNFLRYVRNESQSGFLQNGIRGISFSAPLAINITPALFAMPMKRKRKLDPQFLKLREERKRKKIDREIRSIEKMKKTLKPIEEARMPPVLHYEMDSRRRLVDIPEDVQEYRIKLLKSWCIYKTTQLRKDKKNIERIVQSQQKALDELYKESPELYDAATQIFPDLIPFTYNGPSDSPPIVKYSIPDGEYIDISKNWFENWKPKK